ncbi:GSCOCG00009489001-RA-CDS [Cotesia congregata]|uniref:Similar to Vps8: Vacuolar protein sorting-associated protein 8 homolog (Mus musculus) n=1 Tax=Cotesia congregata TaxID=51543 RepID=A0A8J2HA52_COTCN|nr:GSCOCG00009489001-RA-CDS [Cotesia congregata]CAG5088836.1 Similar to Vps8: Vacuolar protein sorting-associated protein 8 homolog (Mus musculus) [Cotesia congregata]
MAENGFESEIGSQENLAAEAINLDIDELDDTEYAIPAVDKLPSLESILTEPDCASLSGTELDINSAVASSSSSVLGPSNLLGPDPIDGSETTSIGSLLSLNSLNKPQTRNPEFPLSGVILKHAIMRGITSQIKSASEKVNGGLASAVAAGGDMLVIGTSHGLILAFDSKQTLRWCNQEARHQGSVSALGFNHDGSRLLAGFARGHILMIDSSAGKVLRVLTEVHPPGTAVLHVKFTDLPTLALCSDSGGSVFELTFTRTMGVRGCDSKCLFSGSRGEVCTLEPLLLNNLPRHPLKSYILVALATLSKVIVVCIRPRIRVVLTHPLLGPATAPPQVSWQLVVIQAPDASRVIDPVLALARESTVHFYQVCSEAGSRVRLSPLRRITLSYIISNLRWLNTRSLAILDTQERLHLLDVRTQEDLETIDMSPVGISYSSSHFKGLSTGGNVSKAMALAGERASYNTVITYGSQLLLLGTRRLHIVFIRTWSERLRYLTLEKRFPEALALGLAFYQDKGKAVVGLSGLKKVRKRMTFIKTSQVLMQYMQELNKLPTIAASSETATTETTSNTSSSSSSSNINPSDSIFCNNNNNNNNNAENEIISTCVDYAVQLENTHLLFGPLWDLVCDNTLLKGYFLRALETPLLDGSLPPRLPPLIAQQLVALYEKEQRFESLQTIIVLLDIDCLDMHQVTTVCREKCLWEALIHLQTVALGDYTAPVHQLMPILQNYLINKDSLSRECIKLGNALLVYASCCLAGRGFPRGDLPEGQPPRAKAQILAALLSQHSSLAADSERQYPYLRTLLKFDARGFLDVISMAFQEPEFKTEMGYRQRQRLIDILLTIVVPSTPPSPQSQDYLDENKKSPVLVFIANQVANTNVTLEPGVLKQLVELLCTESLSSKIVRDQKLERENAVLQLIYTHKLNGITDNVLLTLAQRVNYYKIAEVIYTARDDWTSVCKCFIADCYRQHQVWSWLEKLSTSGFIKVVLDNIPALVGIDVDRIAGLIAKRIPGKVDKIIERLKNDPSLEYSLLLALFLINQYNDEEASKVELATQQLERLLELMCQYDPARVVGHMNGAHGCRLDQALVIVEKSGHQEALALMYEKMGNFQEAFELLSGILKKKLRDFCDGGSEEDVVAATINVSGLCRRSAGNLDWMPLVETVLKSYDLESDKNDKKDKLENLRGKLLKIVLEALSGTNALSIVLERILKHPLATSGTVGDIRQLLTGVLTHSRYEQILVEKTAKLVSLELHESLKKTLRDAGRACASACTVCPVCRQILSQCTDYTVFFGCGHGFHSQCLGETKLCYKCLTDKGWAPVATNYTPESRAPPERPPILPPMFMRRRDLTLKLGAPTVLPNLEGIF